MLAALASRRVDIPVITCQLFTWSLAGMKYFTKAGEGVEENWHKHREVFPIYGIGQGSCVLFVAWILISMVLINALRDLHKGMTFSTPNGEITTEWPIDSLVDDTTIGTNTSGSNATCLEKAQDLARSWEHLLFLPEGTLARDKCFFYHIDRH